MITVNFRDAALEPKHACGVMGGVRIKRVPEHHGLDGEVLFVHDHTKPLVERRVRLAGAPNRHARHTDVFTGFRQSHPRFDRFRELLFRFW